MFSSPAIAVAVPKREVPCIRLVFSPLSFSSFSTSLLIAFVPPRIITSVASSLCISSSVSVGRDLVAVSSIGALYFLASGTPASASAELSAYASITYFEDGNCAFEISTAVAYLFAPARRCVG